MQYLISFLEGIITFISPCLLPMLPIYLSYFMGETGKKRPAIANALGFVTGFTIMFLAMGAFAGTVGGLLKQYEGAFNLAIGLIMIVFGLNFMGVFRIGILNRTIKPDINVKGMGFFSAVLFGIIFSIGWTPCVGVFLGSALLLASQQGTMLHGIFMLLAYSAGLGVPFLISAVFIDKLKGTFRFIKNNYKIINIISGSILVLVGLLMATGKFSYLFRIFL